VGNDEASWELREQSWKDPRVVLGASDAGAHLRFLATFDWATCFLGDNRRRGVMPLEQAVHRVTGVQALLYGLKGRGFVSPGCVADITVFDPDAIRSGPLEWRDDLPGGAGRVYSEAIGIEHVLVGGVEILRHGHLTGARPGQVLRR
jgi:N-acyl-D-aspartate/D-glutamate deacylase